MDQLEKLLHTMMNNKSVWVWNIVRDGFSVIQKEAQECLVLSCLLVSGKQV